jgi:hypothetical protein
MQKMSLIFGLFLISILSINFISAQYSLNEFLSTLDPGTIISAILFVIFFAVLYFSTSKIFKGNKAISAVVSLGIALLIVYWINQYQAINIGNLFSGFGISDNSLYTIGAFLIIVFIVLLVVFLKVWGWGILGLILLFITFFTDYFSSYSTEFMLIVWGVYLVGLAILIGIYLHYRKKRREKEVQKIRYVK